MRLSLYCTTLEIVNPRVVSVYQSVSSIFTPPLGFLSLSLAVSAAYQVTFIVTTRNYESLRRKIKNNLLDIYIYNYYLVITRKVFFYVLFLRSSFVYWLRSRNTWWIHSSSARSHVACAVLTLRSLSNGVVSNVLRQRNASFLSSGLLPVSWFTP